MTGHTIQIGRCSFSPDSADYSSAYVIRKEDSSDFRVIQLSGEILVQKEGYQWSCEVEAYNIDHVFHRVAKFILKYQDHRRRLFPEEDGIEGDYPPDDSFFFEDYEREKVFAVKGRYIWIVDKESGNVLRFERAGDFMREEFVKTLVQIDADIALLTLDDILMELEPV